MTTEKNDQCVTALLPATLKKQLEERAYRKRISISAYVRELIARELKQPPRRKQIS